MQDVPPWVLFVSVISLARWARRFLKSTLPFKLPKKPSASPKRSSSPSAIPLPPAACRVAHKPPSTSTSSARSIGLSRHGLATWAGGMFSTVLSVNTNGIPRAARASATGQAASSLRCTSRTAADVQPLKHRSGCVERCVCTNVVVCTSEKASNRQHANSAISTRRSSASVWSSLPVPTMFSLDPAPCAISLELSSGFTSSRRSLM